jgi:hypothetical protein
LVRTVVVMAGLGAALITGGLAVSRSEAVPSTNQSRWVEQHVQDVTPGQVYRLAGCLTLSGTGIDYAALRVVWYEQPGGFGPSLNEDDAPADIWDVEEQCLTLAADAPCGARSARYGVVATGTAEAVSVDSASLQLSPEPEATPIACPTPSPSPTPTPTPTAVPRLSPTPTSAPSPSPAPPSVSEPSPQPAEPIAFPSLVNGGFERLREDGTPYGWHKVGGEMRASRTFHAEGLRSVALVSRTTSTKWVYETVRVDGGSFYRLRAAALKNDPGVREALLRVSWYESADGSGSQIDTADSSALAEDSPSFVTLDTGPAQAPPGARSAKVRLLLRPASAAAAVIYFDAIRFEEMEAPPAISAVDSGQAGRSSGEAASPTAEGGSARAGQAAALGARRGPTPLANVRQEAQPLDAPDASGGRPLWPFLLAFGVSAAAAATVTGHAWWRARLAGRNGRHL